MIHAGTVCLVEDPAAQEPPIERTVHCVDGLLNDHLLVAVLDLALYPCTQND